MVAGGPGARLELRLTVPAGPPRRVELGLLPFHPHDGDGALHVDVAIDDSAPRRIVVAREAGTPEWSRGVLDNLLRVPASPPLAPGEHQVTVIARSSGIALDRLMLADPVATGLAQQE
jgi:hypothetical protein